jgi:periplasmic protein TonB
VAGISKRATWVGGLLLVLVLVGSAVWFIHGIVSKKENKPPHVVENVTLIRPPPPPEETPPPPPPPEKVEEPLPQDEPPPSPDNAPAPSPQLGLDAEGTAGGDSFGLAARLGGSEITGTGGAVFAWYTGKLKTAISDCLSEDQKLRGKKYTVGVKIWIEPDGRVKEVRASNGTGNREIDNAITANLATRCRFSESPPLEMPQPVSLQIVSRS